jgi:hypothetical protein
MFSNILRHLISFKYLFHIFLKQYKTQPLNLCIYKWLTTVREAFHIFQTTATDNDKYIWIHIESIIQRCKVC